MKLTGHKTESVYRRYAIVSEADLAAGVQRLAVLHEALARTTRTVVPFDEAEQARTVTIQPQTGAALAVKQDDPGTESAGIFQVPRRGIEPLWPCGRRILSPLRLPVSPPRRAVPGMYPAACIPRNRWRRCFHAWVAAWCAPC